MDRLDGRRDDSPKLAHELVTEFEAEGVSIAVMRLPLRYPKYSIMIGAAYDRLDGTRGRGSRISMHVRNGEADGCSDEVMLALLHKARSFIVERVALDQQNAPPREERAGGERRDAGRAQKRGTHGKSNGGARGERRERNRERVW